MHNNSKQSAQLSFSRGFGMIELMVVVTILGVLALIAIPNFAAMQQRARIRAGAQEVAQDFRHARERAISMSKNITVTSPDQYHYRIASPGAATTTYKLGQTTGGPLRIGTTPPVAGAPPEDPDGIAGTFDFLGGQLIFDSRGGTTRGVIYITNGVENFAVGVNRLGKMAVYQFKNGVWAKL